MTHGSKGLASFLPIGGASFLPRSLFLLNVSTFSRKASRDAKFLTSEVIALYDARKERGGGGARGGGGRRKDVTTLIKVGRN